MVLFYHHPRANWQLEDDQQFSVSRIVLFFFLNQKGGTGFFAYISFNLTCGLIIAVGQVGIKLKKRCVDSGEDISKSMDD